MSDPTTVFVYVASACAVLITILFTVLGVWLILAARSLRRLIDTVQEEIGRVRRMRRHARMGVAFARSWVVVFVRRLLRL